MHGPTSARTSRAACPSGLLSAALWAHRPRCRVPIHARLVAQWRADGRTVPARSDMRWVPSSSARRLHRDEGGTLCP
ncbi:hypothetical protein [Streptomyces zaehneri]|uniref:hypothetical protein n=1 Tax=Streptomyces zaehneri TaxID=3051180 RepID=UPI0028D683C4|nr:hypothetical protein [Streptomyces sp. DSM 40713]